MPTRHKHKIGRYLIQDEETGIIQYDDKITRRTFDNLLVIKRHDEPRHPQEYVKAQTDPHNVKLFRPQQLTPKPNCGTLYTTTITGSDSIDYSILAPPGPFFPFNVGIAKDVIVTARSAEIECTFVVRAENELQSGEPIP